MSYLYQFEDKKKLSEALGDYCKRIYDSAITRHKRFTVAFSGGSLPPMFAEGIKNRLSEIDFSKWEIFLADERCVPIDHQDSNAGLVKKEIFDKLGIKIKPENFHTIDSKVIEESINEGKEVNPDELADLYNKKLIDIFAVPHTVKFPVFDLILLGVGTDGHICSLFPGHELLTDESSWVAAINDSPKLPPKRITLTLPVISLSHNIIFVVTGEEKAEVVHKTFEDDQECIYPCHRVIARVEKEEKKYSQTKTPKGGLPKVTWFLDDRAGSKLSTKRRLYNFNDLTTSKSSKKHSVSFSDAGAFDEDEELSIQTSDV